MRSRLASNSSTHRPASPKTSSAMPLNVSPLSTVTVPPPPSDAAAPPWPPVAGSNSCASALPGAASATATTASRTAARSFIAPTTSADVPARGVAHAILCSFTKWFPFGGAAPTEKLRA